MYQPHNAKKCYLYWKIQIISFLDVALHPWRHSMATKGVEGSKSVLKAANDAGGDSLLFCVRKCDQKSLPQVKNYYTQSFSITNCQSFGWKCGQRWYKPFIIKIIMSTQGDFESILKIQTRPLICFPLMGLVYLCHLLWSNLTCVCGQGRDFLWSMREPVTNFSPCYFSILIPLLCPSTSATAQPKCALLPNPFISIRPEWLFLWWTVFPSATSWLAVEGV